MAFYDSNHYDGSPRHTAPHRVETPLPALDRESDSGMERNSWPGWDTLPALPPECQTCILIAARGGFGPSHDGSEHCESGSIASGGDVAHCTCDVCF